jgi:Transposase DDE domain group 1
LKIGDKGVEDLHRLCSCANRARGSLSRGIALTSTLHWFEPDLLAREENLTGLVRLNRELVARAEGVGSPHRVVLDIDSSESPVYGEQEQSAYDGYFESVCYHALFLFDRQGDCLAVKLRPGNVHSAEGWEEVLLPEIERQQQNGKEVACCRRRLETGR